ncbi:hypothetical protein VNI00_013915 [Paramarasmius palmivorus]|uniref:Uncharacterized protein n=1 Tax=Paramarasmius palmivorus TaxID=297713 RepID=A0AAW0BY17_9AGAR
MLLFWVLAGYLGASVHAQLGDSKFAPNPNWTSSEIAVSPEERIAVTKAAIDESLSMFVVDGRIQIAKPAPWQNYAAAGRLYAQMAQFDSWTNQTLYKDQLLNYFAQTEVLNPDPWTKRCQFFQTII